MAKAKSSPTCLLKSVPDEEIVRAAEVAVEEAPTNMPNLEALPRELIEAVAEPAQLAVLVSRRWGAKGINLGVSFLDNPPADLRDRLLSHMNSWGEFSNVKFSWSQSGGQVRVTRVVGSYWSYLGTDILLIPKGQATMNLGGFTMSTSEAEYKRVVRHETGHTCGFPHEHLRKSLIQRLDVAKTLTYFEKHYGWSKTTTMDNVLTPLEDWSVLASTAADEDSVMAYEIASECTKDGRPIRGGNDISPTDRLFAAHLYPLSLTATKKRLVIDLEGDVKSAKIVELT